MVELHDEALRRHGGATGVRDLGGLISSVMAPKNHWHYSKGGDLFDLAAVLLSHLGRNHPFVDGNKHSPAASAIASLAINGVFLETNDEILEDATLRAVQGHLEPEALAGILRTLPRLD